MKEPSININSLSKYLYGDIFGGFAAMLVALPSAIAFGLIIYAPLGSSCSSTGMNSIL